VHVDDVLAIVDKPAGLVVHPASSHKGRTLVDELTSLLGGGPDPGRPGIVHRLDKDTSGLMVVARTDQAHRALAEQIRRRELGRTYLALAQGRLDSRSGMIDAPIGRDRRRRTRMAVRAGGRQARTHFEVLELLPADTYLEARLETGRTHQIRAHFAAIGHPLAGDPRYGGGERHGLRRQFLHSHRLALTHPVSGERMEFDSELPVDLAEALALARRPA
jgi:23S rRNA pseudouridine1911/1915/1917 synthase